jgi:altronate dehydratase large subunit
MTEFIGFPRPDGSVGVRNHVVLLGLGESGANICHRAAGFVNDAMPLFCNAEDRGFLLEVVRHPNVAGGIVTGDLEEDSMGGLMSDLERTGKPHHVIDMGKLGTMDAVSRVTQSTVEIIRDVSTQRRELTRVAKLMPALIHVPVELGKDVLEGFMHLMVKENGCCLWVGKGSRGEKKVDLPIGKHMRGDAKPGQGPGSATGIYRLDGLEKAADIWKQLLVSGTQVMAFPADAGPVMSHPLIPGLGFSFDRDSDCHELAELDVSQVRDKGLKTEDMGLLLFSEILATASGKLTREEVLRNVVLECLETDERGQPEKT